MSVPKWKSLQQSAELRRKAADHEKAVDLYNQALAHPNVPWKAFVDMTMRRAYCQRMLGQFNAADDSLTALAELAIQRGDDATVVRAYGELIMVLHLTGELKRGLQLGKEAHNIAQRSGQPDLKADALLSLGLINSDSGEYQEAQGLLIQAQALIAPEDVQKQLRAHFINDFDLGRTGKYQEMKASTEHALEIARGIGDRDWEGKLLNQLAIFTSDMTLKRSLYEQALTCFEAAGDKPYQATIIFNSGTNDTELGLYQTAIGQVRNLLAIDRENGNDLRCAYDLYHLGRNAIYNGDLPSALASLQEGLVLTQKLNLIRMEFGYQLGLGNCYTLLEQPAQAIEAFQIADALPYKQDIDERLLLLALRSNASILAGDHLTARKQAGQALAMIDNDKMDDLTSQYGNADFVCWYCYRAHLPSKTVGRKGRLISHKAWHALELGLKFMFIPIQNMSDAGLRRLYLHHNPYHRLMILEWLKQVPEHDVGLEDMASFTADVQKPGRLDEVFHRLLKVGVRLNAERDPSRLPDEIVQEVEELSGAERIALVLLDEQGNRRMVKTLLPRPTYRMLSGTVESPADSGVFLHEIQPWLEEATTSRQGFIRQINPDAGLTEQRSILTSPLISQGKLVGVIYCDLRGCFGRFDPEDLDLLGVLANQSAVAVENADWSATLEQKVTVRTTELQQSNDQLEQRNAELAVINSIQQGLAAQLDIQGIFDLVGDKIRQIFDAQMVLIDTLDFETGTVTNRYFVEKGQRYYPESRPLFKLHVLMQRTHETVVINRDALSRITELGIPIGGGSEAPRSAVFVPLLVGENVRGVISIQNSDREEAFDEASIHLLTTITNSMSVALENARLFDETQHLLKETEQRNAELAIINSVQEGLASKLDMQEIYDLVCDKVRQIFASDVVALVLYDEDSGMTTIPHMFDHGQRYYPAPQPVNRKILQRLKTNEPILIGTHAELLRFMAEYGLKNIGGPTPDNSHLYMPIVTGEKTMGVISIAKFSEHAFNESDVRLLRTLVNSMSVALENARLFDETQRLVKAEQARVGELEIINSIQQGLAKELDFQAIVDLVGDKLQEVLHTGDLGIRWYEEKANILHHLYLYEHGKRMKIKPGAPLPGGAFEQIRQALQPVIANTQAHYESISAHVPGTDYAKSGIAVPIISSDKVLGIITIDNYEREYAFGESEVRLLTTIAASLGTALENARLFDETQRLVKAEQARVAELEIINSIQQGLAAELDFQAIIDLVGDKLREVFASSDMMISWYDEKNDTAHHLYLYEHGERITAAPTRLSTPGSLFESFSKHRTLEVWNNKAESSDFPTIPGTATSTSGIAIPIISSDKIIGAIQLFDIEKENAYGEAEQRLLTTVAASLGTTLENARLFDETQRLLKETEQRNAELAIINSVQAALAAELNIQGIYDAVGDKIREIFHSDNLEIRILDPQTNLLRIPYLYENNQRITIEPQLVMEKGFAAHVLRTRETIVINENMEQEIEKYGSFVYPGTQLDKSCVMVPLIVGDQARGLVNLSNFEREHAFSESDVRLLQTLVNSMSVALENARLFNETQRLLAETEQRNAELAIINSVQAALAAELNIQGIYDAVGDKIREIFQSDNINIRIYEPRTSQLFTPYMYENGERVWMEPIKVTDENRGKGFTGYVIDNRQTLVINENMDQAIEKYDSYIFPGTKPDKSAVYVPLIVGDQAFGLINLSNLEHEHAFSDSDVRLLQTLVNSMSVALENARLFNETQRLLKETEQRAAELAILNSVGDAMARQLDVKTITHLVGDKVRDIFSSESVIIWLYDPDTNLMHPPFVYDKGYIDTDHTDVFDSDITNPIKKAIVVDRRSLLFGTSQEMIAAGAEVYPYSDAEGGMDTTSSFMGVPIIVGERVRGVVSVQSYREHAYDESNLRLLSTLASSMGVAIENARLFQETQRLLAETEQRNSELAIINSVQAALAAELNIQGIYDAVGDKIRNIFNSNNLEIRVYDPNSNLEYFPYCYENGKRIELEPLPRIETGFSAHVARTRETLIINENMMQEIEKYGSYLMPGTQVAKSSVYVPLIVGDQVRGLVGLSDFEHEHAFSDSDVRLLQTLVNSMSVALENARLFAETQRLLEETSQRASELAIINSVSQSMSSQLQVESIVRTVGDQVRDSFHSEVVNIALYDPANNLIHLPYCYDRQYVTTEPFPYGSGLTSKVLHTKQPLILGSFEEITSGGAILTPNAPEDELMPQSYLGVPIIVGDKAIGVIDVQSYKRFVYNDSHVRLLSTLASSMGVALENARLFEETRRLLAETEQRNRELAIISRIGQALAGQLDPQGIFELVGEELQGVFDAQVVAIITYDRQEDLVHWRYVIEKGKRETVSPSKPAGFSGNILRTRQPVLISHDYAQRAVEYGSKVVAGEAPKSYLGVPLIAGGEATGVITLQNIDREEAFNENDLRLLSTLALSMGVALENARLYQETQHHAVEMATLAEIGSDIASTHEMEPVLERMASKTRELMQVRDIAMYLLQPDGHTLRPIVSQGKYAEETKAQLITLGHGITGSVAQRGVAEIINFPEQDKRAIHIEGTADDVDEPECFMVAPLISRGRLIGVISVYRDRDQGLFNQLELDFLVSLARQAAIAIESARLYAETERRATEMAALAEVSREISATLELQSVLERIAGQARELLSAASSAVYLLQPDGVAIKAIAAEGDVAQEVLADEDSQLGVGIIGSIVKSGVAEWINDTGKDTRGVQIPGTKDIPEGEKLLVAPLMIQERAIGALAVWRNPDDPLFNQAELSFSIGLAQQAVVAIENARLFETAQESQRRMADIINFLPDPTLVIDREGKVIAWNHAIEEMTGVKTVDILGKGNYEYALPFYGKRRPILIDTVLVHDEEVESKYAHILRHENVVVGEAITQLKGQTTYLNATASALRNSKGEAVGAIESIRDITDQKKAEQELHQAKAEAEAANQAKSAFLAMMSHEIRTPMNAIIGMSGLLMDTTLNPDQREFAETIRSSGDSLLTIINDILDFSKIEAGKMTLDEQPFDLRECIEASLDLIKVKASEKSLELAYQMEPGVPPAVLGDVTRVRQVLINLLGNSVKFTDHGEIILTVNKGDKKGSLHFSVRDTGIGIAPDRVSQLFRPFTQADTSISRRYGGTGLGLALSSRLVDLMGGKMWVESEGVPGKGSTFHFVIHAKAAPDWKGHPLMQGEHPQLRDRRILVVDDNATNRRILELQTKAWGMQPRECPSPQEALDILQQGNVFDLAIVDMHMPTMSGIELASEIRKLEASHPDKPKLPLVLSTSLGGREEARESAEFVAILMKPIRQSALFDTLMTIFAGRGKPAVKTAGEHFTLDPEMAGRHPLRILLAEDNVVNQKLALRLLSQMGYRADVAANGLEVLQAVKRQPYDVILMDVQMPEMDGLEATRRLCADVQAGIRPRIIAMTANAMQGDREMCLEAGMDDYLSKPIRVDELVTALNLAQPRSTV